MFSRHTSALSRRLVRWVALLSLIAIAGLIVAVIVGLLGTLQTVQRKLDDTATTAVRAFDQFLGGIESDLLATSDALSLSAGGTQATSDDVSKLLRHTLDRQFAIFELTLVNPQGQVLAQRRRVGGETGAAPTEQPWLAVVESDQVYVGPVDSEEFGVPFTDLAVRVTDEDGNFAATLLARVDLTTLWNTTIGLHVGKTGYVYVTDETGQLLAYRDLKLLQGDSRLENLISNTPQAIAQPGLDIYFGLGDQLVVASGVQLDVAPWFVIIEQPVGEALGAFLMQSMVFLAALTIVGVLVYNILRFTRYQIVSPLRLLHEGVDVFSQGNLESRIDIQTKDEFGTLATAFNAMATRLRETIDSLEERVAERTADLEATTSDLTARSTELEAANQRQAEINRQLEEAVRHSQRRAALLQASAQVSRAIAQIRDQDQLLLQVTQLISQHFDYYHTGVFLIDEAGRNAVLHAANSEGGQRMLARQHKLGVGSESIVGYVAAAGRPRIALDVGLDAIYFDNPDMPDTRSEMAVPLRIGDKIIGALDVQSTREAAFVEEDVTTLTALADQITIAIENARLFQQTQATLEEAKHMQRRYVQQEWSKFSREQPDLTYEYTLTGFTPTGDVRSPEAQEAWLTGELIVTDNASASPAPPRRAALAAPIKVRGEIIGVLDLQEIEGDSIWNDDQIALVQSVADQLGQALESARLFEETQRRARREALTRQITDRVRSKTEVDAMLQTAVRELAQALGAPRAFVRLAPEALAADDGQSALED